MIRVTADSLSFTLPTAWAEVSTAQALALRSPHSIIDAFSILTGLSKEQLRPLRAPDLDDQLLSRLAFISNAPDFTLLPVPKSIRLPRPSLPRPVQWVNSKLPFLKLGYRRVDALVKIGSQTTIAQKWDVDHAIKALSPEPDEYGDYPDQPEPGLLDLAQVLLSIYLAPSVNSRPYEGDQDAADCWEAIKHLPCTTLLPLAAFFLTRHYQKTQSGRLFIRPTLFPSSPNTN